MIVSEHGAPFHTGSSVPLAFTEDYLVALFLPFDPGSVTGGLFRVYCAAMPLALDGPGVPVVSRPVVVQLLDGKPV